MAALGRHLSGSNGLFYKQRACSLEKHVCLQQGGYMRVCQQQTVPVCTSRSGDVEQNHSSLCKCLLVGTDAFVLLFMELFVSFVFQGLKKKKEKAAQIMLVEEI